MEHESSIHDFDFSLICRYFSLLRRQGPGSDAITRKALSLIPTGLSVSKAADLGCGTGTQTMVLAEGLRERQDADNLEITALDLFPQFLDILSLRSRERGLDGIISCLPGDMSQLPFQNGSLDLIWSEGAIYNVGFRSGLEQWKRFLRPGGCIAVSDATWLTNERPAEVEEFWRDAYPQIGTTSERLAIMEELGFTVLGTILLPDSCWTENFYAPAVAAQEQFLSENAGNEFAEELVRNQRHEAEIFRKYHEYYGYVFYIGQKLK